MHPTHHQCICGLTHGVCPPGTSSCVRALRVLCMLPCRCGAVLSENGAVWYSDGEPSKKLMESFIMRSGNQITTLEVLAICFGLSTFLDKVAGRKVIIYSDNTDAEQSVRRGSANPWDQCQLVHGIWTMVEACMCVKFL